MAAHASILAWRIPWREEPGRLESIGSPLKPLSMHAHDSSLIQSGHFLTTSFEHMKFKIWGRLTIYQSVLVQRRKSKNGLTE